MRCVVACLWVLALGPVARADAPLVVLRGAPEAVARWRSALAPAAPPPRSPRGALGTLNRVAALLDEARRAAGDLREGSALRALVEARRLLEAAAAVPGAARWLAEVELRLGVVAAQAGRPGLADEAFARAALFDVARVLRPAEAPPDVAAQAERARLEVAARPEGRFEVRVEPGLPGALVHLDGRSWGGAPLVLRARVGRHVLQVEAPGRARFGQVIDVFPGERPPRVVRLPRSARAQLEARLDAAPSVDEVPQILASSTRRVWWIRVARDGRRALRLRCSAAGCGPVERLDEADLSRSGDRPHGAALPGSPSLRLSAARAWLTGPANVEEAPPPGPPRAAIGVMGALAAALAGGIAAALFAPRPDPGPRLRVDPGDLAP